MIKAVQGCARVRAGQIDAGSADLEEAVAWFDQYQLRYTRSLFALWLAEAYLSQDAPTRARVVLEEVLSTTSKLGYRHLEGVAERLFAESLFHDDRIAAETRVERAIGILEPIGAQNELAKALVDQAELRRLAGDLPRAREGLERALAIFESLGTLHEPKRVRAMLGALHAST
jgi:tetratricopeptide (TPR) repeat protein